MDILIIFFLHSSSKNNDHKPTSFRPSQRLKFNALIKFLLPGCMVISFGSNE